jgi:hypothetical protein
LLAQFEHFFEVAFGMNSGEIIDLPQFLPRDSIAMQKLPFSLSCIVEYSGVINSAGGIHVGPANSSFYFD